MIQLSFFDHPNSLQPHIVWTLPIIIVQRPTAHRRVRHRHSIRDIRANTTCHIFQRTVPQPLRRHHVVLPRRRVARHAARVYIVGRVNVCQHALCTIGKRVDAVCSEVVTGRIVRPARARPLSPAEACVIVSTRSVVGSGRVEVHG